MNIHQFNMQFNPEEDRIIFRLNTVNGEEFRFFLTRRFVKVLWPVLLQLLSNDLKRREPVKAHVVKEVLEFEREEVVSKANFKQQYVEQAKTFPLGEDIILLFRIQVKQAPGGDILCLHPSKGKGIEFMVNNTFLHPFCKLLQDAVIKAQWELDYLFAQNRPVEKAQPSPKVLH
ncbi:hypothetical protein [Desulfonema magnum]|uniref:Uncharacterized protein n=1 Tax=Desulfonema magnum TaxID=45655 RepID=A0A975GNK0_9BACT|nr:hypothetical protein [Desulfonema magnum]QTA87854.1 Uncharacterized protein dnm_038920 [Desulfonema magnum]